MTGPHERQREILKRAAEYANRHQVQPGGLWFYTDVRNNFYYAAALFAASCDSDVELSFDRMEGRRLASAILARVLELQDTDPASPTYGHWPLRLTPDSDQTEPHALPVEIMGSLMVFFYRKYGSELEKSIAASFEAAFRMIYDGGFFRREIQVYSHHEAKFTAAKLIFGQLFQDLALLEDGRRSLHSLIVRLKEKGMPEYGCLPWFWHWVQAFTCAWELADQPDIRSELSVMLDWLWEERACFYLKGAWAGPRSRSWPHDVPKDSNVLFDYVQFGDFKLPEAMPRLEFAGLLFYAAPERAKRIALGRTEPVEVVRRIYPAGAGEGSVLHSYTYMTERYAVGGIAERVQEFDNEQLRFTITFPVPDDFGVNHAYFFHPGEGFDFSGLDLRHQSGHMELMVQKGTAMALFSIPDRESDRIIGVLPKGRWVRSQNSNSLFGWVYGVYVKVHMMRMFEVEERVDRLLVRSKGRENGVVMEVVEPEHHALAIVQDVLQFADWADGNSPAWGLEPLRIAYRNADGEVLVLKDSTIEA